MSGARAARSCVCCDLSRFVRKEEGQGGPRHSPDCWHRFGLPDRLVGGYKLQSFYDCSSTNYAVSGIFRIVCGKLERLHANSSCDRQNSKSTLNIPEKGLQVWR